MDDHHDALGVTPTESRRGPFLSEKLLGILAFFGVVAGFQSPNLISSRGGHGPLNFVGEVTACVAIATLARCAVVAWTRRKATSPAPRPLVWFVLLLGLPILAVFVAGPLDQWLAARWNGR